jgi:hypothetical protein
LRRRADTGDWAAISELVLLLRERGDFDGAAGQLRRSAEADASVGGGPERPRPVVTRGELAELRRRADRDDWEAGLQLARVLGERNDVDGLRRRADSGDWAAARELARLLREQGEFEELRRRADVGDDIARVQLARLLREQGDLDGAAALLRRVFSLARGDADEEEAKLLHDQRDWDELRRRADRGNAAAIQQLARLLREVGDVEELRRRAEAGAEGATVELVRLLCEQGDFDAAAAAVREPAGIGLVYGIEALTAIVHQEAALDRSRRRAAGHDAPQ